MKAASGPKAQVEELEQGRDPVASPGSLSHEIISNSLLPVGLPSKRRRLSWGRLATLLVILAVGGAGGGDPGDAGEHGEDPSQPRARATRMARVSTRWP